MSAETPRFNNFTGKVLNNICDDTCFSVNQCELRHSASVSSLVSPCLNSKRLVSSKSFLVGSLGVGTGSMMGIKELNIVIPNNHIFVYIVTWNLSLLKSQNYPEDLSDLLSNLSSDQSASIYAVCIQECPTEKNELLIRLQLALGPKHVLFTCATHGSLALAIFLIRDLIWYTSVPQSISITTTTAVRTKGAVAICFILFGTSLLFLSAHFKANENNFGRRVQDYTQIVENLNLPKIGLRKGYRFRESNPFDRFDAVFWAGDLNFRINKPRHIVNQIIKFSMEMKNFDSLLAADELINGRAQGIIFEKFEEGRIKFPPTYKFDPNTNDYDSSDKQRVPSYTDRILYLCRRKGDITCVDYNMVDNIKCSDHKAVCGLFSLIVKPGCDNIALSAGSFNRDIYIEGNQRRAVRLDLLKRRKSKAHNKGCSLQ